MKVSRLSAYSTPKSFRKKKSERFNQESFVSDDIVFIENDKLKISFINHVLLISGKIDDPNPDTYIQPMIEKVSRAAGALGLKEIPINITELEFLNSRGLKQLITWIIYISQLPPRKQYSLKFIYSADNHWQNESVTVISKFNPKIVHKEIAV